ncbi:MAG TPA: hypothetical protein PKK26_14375, partial [Candidatus Wallbacteria bacterium]|nr:hypothetical protein [Candidatus Wallbacteria bacterium]
NTKFGAFQNFDNFDIPKDCPDDSWVSSGALKSANIETKIKEVIPEAKINFIKIKFDTQKKVDDNLTFGILTISCQAEYRSAKRTVSVQKQVELYRDLSVMYQYSFAVNEDKATQEILARRKNTGGLFNGGGISIGWTSSYVPQTLIVNNGVKWADSANTKLPAKIFGRKLVVELNETRDAALLMAIPSAMSSLVTEGLESVSLLIKLCSKDVDTKLATVGLTKGHNGGKSPMIDKIQHTGVPLGLSGFLTEINPANYVLSEVDYPTGWSELGNQLAGFVASTGGSRGNVDLTGHFPPMGWFAKAFDFVAGGFRTLFGIPDSPTVHNLIYGDVQRRYGELTSGWGGALLSKNEKRIEPYDFELPLPPIVPADIIGNNGQLTYLYDKDTYKRMAMRHDICVNNIDLTNNNSLKGEKIPHVFDSATNNKLFEERKYIGEAAWGLLKAEKSYKNVVWRPFWGWADTADQCEKEFPWYDFVKVGKNVFTAATLDSKFAMHVNGIYFVDGDALVEGFYKGRGAIVATGNIIIAGQILRHSDDGVFDAGCQSNYEFLRGCNNCLQLIALGTAPATQSQAYPGATGKIIFAPHAYNKEHYASLFSGFQSYFSKRPYVRIDAYMYGKNGMMMDDDSRKDGFKVFGGTDNTFMAIFGNYTCQEINWKEEGVTDMYPDKIIINTFQKWIDIIKDTLDKKYCTINYNVSNSDNFIQQKD